MASSPPPLTPVSPDHIISPVSPLSPYSETPSSTPSALTPSGTAAAVFIAGGKLAFVEAGADSVILLSSDAPPEEGLFQRPSGHRVLSLATSPRDPYLATGSVDGFLSVWNIATRDVQWMFPDTTPSGRSVHSISFSQDSRFIASSGTNFIHLWSLDPLTGANTTSCPVKLPIPHKVHSIAFSPAAHNKNLLAVACADNKVRVYDTTNLLQVGRALTGHQGPVLALAWSPDGNQLLICDYKIAFWSFSPRSPDRWTRDTPSYARGHTNPIASVTFSPDGRYIATASKGPSGSIRIWNATTGEQVEKPFGSHFHSGGFSLVAFSPDGTRLLSFTNSGPGGRGIHQWDVRSLDLPSQVRDLRDDVGYLSTRNAEYHEATQTIFSEKIASFETTHKSSVSTLQATIKKVEANLERSTEDLGTAIVGQGDAHSAAIVRLREEVQQAESSRQSDKEHILGRFKALDSKITLLETNIQETQKAMKDAMDAQFEMLKKGLKAIQAQINTSGADPKKPGTGPNPNPKNQSN